MHQEEIMRKSIQTLTRHGLCVGIALSAAMVALQVGGCPQESPPAPRPQPSETTTGSDNSGSQDEGTPAINQARESFAQALDTAGDASNAALLLYKQSATLVYNEDPEQAPSLWVALASEQLASDADMEAYAQLEENAPTYGLWIPASQDTLAKRRDAQQTQSSRDVVAIYVNGINTPLVEADADTMGLATLLTRGPAGTEIKRLTGVGLHWNHSAADQQRSFWGGVLCPTVFASSPLLRDRCQSLGGFVDLSEAAFEKVLDWFATPTVAARHGIDAQTLAQRVAGLLNEDLAVLLIGHSQGNFKIVQSLQLLWSNDDGSGAPWAASDEEAHRVLRGSVAVIAIGSPADYVEVISKGMAVRKFNIRTSAGFERWKTMLGVPLGTVTWTDVLLGAVSHLDEDIVSLFDDTQPPDEYLPHPLGIRTGDPSNLLFPSIHSLYDCYLLYYGAGIREVARELVNALARPSSASSRDSDGDGVPDDQDGCPDDPNKTEPGNCGCGVAETPYCGAPIDSDGDGVPDDQDGCPNDPNKTSPGNCGCGVPDTPDCGQPGLDQPWVTDADTVALWHLDGDGIDASGNGNDLAVKSDRVTWVSGKFSQSAEMGTDPWSGSCFNSDGGALTAPGSGCTYPGYGDWTIEAWIYLPADEFPTRSGSILIHYSKHRACHEPYYLVIEPGPVLAFEIESEVGCEGAEAIIRSDVSAYVGQWIHVAGVYRYQQDMSLWINGELVAQESTTLVPETLPNYDVFVGGSFCGTSTGLLVDEVRISSVARYQP